MAARIVIIQDTYAAPITCPQKKESVGDAVYESVGSSYGVHTEYYWTYGVLLLQYILASRATGLSKKYAEMHGL